MRWKKFLKATCIMLVMAVLGNSVNVSCAESKYAYTVKKAAVLDKDGKKVTSFSKGITFKYKTITDSLISFNYLGKTRYMKTSDVIAGDGLTSYIKSNQSKFNLQAVTLQKTSVYDSKSEKSKVIKEVGKDNIFKIFDETDTWFKVQLDGEFGYVKKSDCKKRCVVDVVTFPKIVGVTKGEQIVNYAKKFVGNPYVWGGTSLTSGADCSGFVQSVFKNFGYSLPRCSYEQATCGKAVDFSELKPGDLIFYYRGSRIGHVTIYAGNGKCVQARGSDYGIVITDYDYSTPAFARRII